MQKLKQVLLIIIFFIFNVSIILLFSLNLSIGKNNKFDCKPNEYVFWTLSTGNANYQILQKQERSIIFDCGIGGPPKYWDQKNYGQNSFPIFLMNKLKIKTIEAVIVSHYHTDHYNNLIALLNQENIQIENLLLPFNWDVVSGQKQRKIIENIKMKFKTKILDFQKNYNLLNLNINNLTANALNYLKNLNPFSNQNNFLYVFKFEIMNKVFLVTGDMEELLFDAIDQEKGWEQISKINFLTLPHHGSKVSATFRILDRFLIDYVMVCATSREDKNWLQNIGSKDHNFPDKQVYEELRNYKLNKVYLTGAAPIYWKYPNINKTFSYHIDVVKNSEYFKDHDLTVIKNN